MDRTNSLDPTLGILLYINFFVIAVFLWFFFEQVRYVQLKYIEKGCPDINRYRSIFHKEKLVFYQGCNIIVLLGSLDTRQ